MKKPVVYVASPYSSGDKRKNAIFQCKMFNEFMDDGHIWPIVPLWTHFQDELFPRPYEDWLQYDLALLERYDACIRLNATCDDDPDYLITESSGADREVDRFTNLGKPVFYSKDKLYEWAKSLA